MFSPDEKSPDKRTIGSVLAEELLKDTHRTLVAEMQIEQRAAGAWTGKLVTGETNGEAAADKPGRKTEGAGRFSNNGRPMHGADRKIPGARWEAGRKGEVLHLVK